MNITTALVCTVLLLLPVVHCSTPTLFHSSPEWDESVQLCLRNLGNEVPHCGDYILERVSRSQLHAISHGNNKAWKAVVRKLCLSYETKGRLCFHEYLRWISPCLNETQLHQEKAYVRMVQSSWWTLCSHKGWKVIGLFNTSTVQCVQHHSYGLLQCLHLLQLDHFSQVPDHLAKLLLEAQCSKFTEGTSCILKELEQCSDQSAALIMEKEFEELFNASPCVNSQQHQFSKEQIPEHLNNKNEYSKVTYKDNASVAAEIGSSNQPINEMEQDNEAVDVTELVPDELVQKCIDNKDNEAYRRAKMARQKLTQCGSSLLHTDKLLQEVRAAVLSNGQGMIPIVKRFCKVFQTSGQLCLTQYLNNLVPCLNETDKEVEELVVKMVETSWEYSCHKDAFRAILFLRNSTLSCMEMQSPDVVECIAPYLGRLRAAGDPTRAVAEVLVKKECSLYTSVTGCIVEKLQQCPDQTAAEIVRGSFNETLRISPCAGYLPPKRARPGQESPVVPTLQKFETTLQKLVETINMEHTRQEAAREGMLTALEQQTKLLKHMSDSLESIVPLIKHGRGKKGVHF